MEGSGLDDTTDQCGKLSVRFFKITYDLVNRGNVVVLRAAAKGVGEHLLGEAAIVVTTAGGDEEVFELCDVRKCFAGDQSATRVRDWLAKLMVAP